MFKRFHDRDKWHKPWYRKLSPAEKCAWEYITSECDNVGVWEADTEAAEYFIGSSVDWESFRNKCNNNIYLMPNGKWWLVDFCRFQYPELSEDTESRPLLSYVSLLKKHNLWIPYINGIYTVQDKDKDKDKDKGKDKNIKKEKKEEKHKYGDFQNILLTDTEKGRLIKEMGQPFFDRLITFYSAWKEEKKPKTASDNLTIRRWVIDAVKEKEVKAAPKQAVTGRSDALTRDEIAEHREAVESAKPATNEELAELERLKGEAIKSPVGRAIVGMLGRGE